jgi:hypothetical protein
MKSLPLSTLLHENMAIVATFVFSQEPINRLKAKKFRGEWKFLDKFTYEIPASKAIRACLESAILIRQLGQGWEEVVTHQFGHQTFGVLHCTGGTTEPLSLSEPANKIIHASELHWDLSVPETPKLVCIAPTEEHQKFGWTKAEVHIVDLIAYAAQLGS